MKQLTKSNWLVAAGLLLSLPAAYFISTAFLKYELGVDGPFDDAYPLFESLGVKEDLGWNINLLILLGPIAGFLLCVFQVLKIRWEFTKEEFRFQFTVRKRWFPILAAAFSASLLGLLALYLFGENCTC
jgi:hypothetical protein